MTTRHSLFGTLLLAGLLLAGCGAKSPDDSKVIARVNGDVITEKDYEDYLRARQMQQPPIPDPKKEREVVLDEMINRVLLVNSATEYKVDRELDVYLQLKRQRENVLARAMLRKYLQDNPISDEEVQKRYQELSAKADKNEYRARHILVHQEDEARALLAQLRKGANFASLARQKSVDVGTGRNGGELGGWFSQDQVVPEFYEAVHQLKKGETTRDPVKSQFGWHIIKLEDVRARTMPDFEQVKGNIRQMIQQERVEALLKSIKDKAKIKIEPATAEPAATAPANAEPAAGAAK
jgi:peptidyl-prolyl cis-trans isomerase C